MKKVITIMGLFGFMIVQAQVGINKDKPDATLDIVAEKTDGSQVEGLLVPRISKEAAYNMAIATTKPQESNLVYVNNANYNTFPAGATDAQKATVADITEKGYYFWNETKWVSISTVEGSLWRYANDKVFVDRSSITDNVEYLKEGGYRHFPRNMRQLGIDINSASIYRWNLAFSDLIKTKSLSQGWPYKTLGQNSLYIDENEVSSIENYYANVNYLSTMENTTKNITALYSALNTSAHYGQGNVIRMTGAYNNTILGGSKVIVSAMHGAFNQISVNSPSSTVKHISGSMNYPTIRSNSTVTDFMGTYNNLLIFPNTSPTITNTVMTNNRLHIDATSGGQMDNLYGTLTEVSLPNASSLKIKNMYGSHIREMTKGQQKNYGILIENVGNSTATENYAIYTKAGKVRFGDDVGVGIAEATKPQAKLDVNGYIKLGSADTTADVTPKAGMLRYNTNTDKFQGYVEDTNPSTTEKTSGWVDLH